MANTNSIMYAHQKLQSVLDERSYTQAEFNHCKQHFRQFSSSRNFPGMSMLRECEEFRDPGNASAGDAILEWKGRPFAIYETGEGFRYLPQPPDKLLTPGQFEEVVGWIFENSIFSLFPGLELLRKCTEIPPPKGCRNFHNVAVYALHGHPVALFERDSGFRVVF